MSEPIKIVKVTIETNGTSHDIIVPLDDAMQDGLLSALVKIAMHNAEGPGDPGVFKITLVPGHAIRVDDAALMDDVDFDNAEVC